MTHRIVRTVGADALFTPLQVGSTTIPNRIAQTAHSKQYSDRVESPRETAYWVRRAQGGCGLFIAGNHFVHPSGSIRGFEDGFDPAGIGPARAMTDAVHDAGSRIFVQLNHHGAQATADGRDGPRPVYSPSRMISPSTSLATREASHADLRSFADGWARSAVHAREAGFDGVEVHMAHGYLLHQFFSPLYNARQDGYGGDLEGRTRFPREVLSAVRAAVGDDFTVGIRIVADEVHPRGLDAAQMRTIIARLQEEAKIDFLDLATGGYHNVHYVFPSSAVPAAWLRERAREVKRAFPDTPVFAVGAAESVERAGEVITEGIADVVGLTRAQIADPDLAHKLRDGGDIQHCIRLNQGCLGRGSRGLPVSCTVNPIAGRERERPPRPRTATPRRFAVVGGGPAGMRAAIELARDGHRVTLHEREAELGGQLRYARRVPGRETVGLLVDDLTRDLLRAGVEVRLLSDGPGSDTVDEVIVATGARVPQTTSLAFGSAMPQPMPPGVRTAADILSAPDRLTGRVAVVDSDGTAYASGLVLMLLPHVERLELVSGFEVPFPHVGAGYDRQLLLETLGAHGGFRRHASHVVESVSSLRVRDTLTGVVTELDVDTVVAIEPRESVVPELPADVRSVTIGDALAPRTIDSAIFEAVELAYREAGMAEVV